jgi:hypothetical protein
VNEAFLLLAGFPSSFSKSEECFGEQDLKSMMGDARTAPSRLDVAEELQGLACGALGGVNGFSNRPLVHAISTLAPRLFESSASRRTVPYDEPKEKLRRLRMAAATSSSYT